MVQSPRLPAHNRIKVRSHQRSPLSLLWQSCGHANNEKNTINEKESMPFYLIKVEIPENPSNVRAGVEMCKPPVFVICILNSADSVRHLQFLGNSKNIIPGMSSLPLKSITGNWEFMSYIILYMQLTRKTYLLLYFFCVPTVVNKIQFKTFNFKGLCFWQILLAHTFDIFFTIHLQWLRMTLYVYAFCPWAWAWYIHITAKHFQTSANGTRAMAFV